MLGSLEILKPGLMTSIQDLGRKGLAYYAIPTSGVMDVPSAKIANLLLNKSEDAALIECTSIAPHIRFDMDTQIAITGADFNWKINDLAVHRNRPLEISNGDILKGQFTQDGMRGYIAINGVLEASKVYNSFSTYSNAEIGGHNGKLLRKGDVLKWDDRVQNNMTIPFRKGPEYNYLTEISKAQLTINLYKIGSDSNRMGVRLDGGALNCSSKHLDFSVPVLPGFVQLPPSGLPIVVLQDGQTTGGYPRIAYVPIDSLSILNQIPFGQAFRFSCLDN